MKAFAEAIRNIEDSSRMTGRTTAIIDEARKNDVIFVHNSSMLMHIKKELRKRRKRNVEVGVIKLCVS